MEQENKMLKEIINTEKADEKANFMNQSLFNEVKEYSKSIDYLFLFVISKYLFLETLYQSL